MSDDLDRLVRLAAHGDLEAGRAALIDAVRRNRPEAAAAVRQGVPELAWPGCDYIGRNTRGHRRFWHVHTGLVLVEIPGGPFRMGDDDGDHDDAKPSHEVSLSTYLIGELPVSHALFWRFVQARPEWAPGKANAPTTAYGWKRKRRPLPEQILMPICSLSWHAASAFCAWAGLALPSEAQWEKAARGVEGRTNAISGLSQNTAASVRQELAKQPIWHPDLARRPPDWALDLASPSGCLAMGWGPFASWEWCADWYDARAYAHPSATAPTDPEGPEAGRRRVMRGVGPTLARRMPANPDGGEPFYTFRVALAVPGDPLAEPTPEDRAGTRAFLATIEGELTGLDARLRPGPIDPTTLTSLKAIGQARREVVSQAAAGGVDAFMASGAWREACKLAGVEVAAELPSTTTYRLTEESATALAADLASLSPVALICSVPRDKKGRLELKTTTLLAEYETSEPLPSRGHGLWLVACAPQRRRDPQVLALELQSVNADMRSWRFDRHRHLWDARVADTPAPQRWALPGLPAEGLGLPADPSVALARIAALQQSLSKASDDDEHAVGLRAALCVVLQDAGRLAEALALYDIELGEAAEGVFEGRAESALHRQHLESWATALQEGIRRAALWTFAQLLRDEIERLEAWRAEKRGRPAKLPQLTLFSLPHQTATRKDRVVLVPRSEAGGARLEVVTTGSDDRLAATWWERPLELDLWRFGLG